MTTVFASERSYHNFNMYLFIVEAHYKKYLYYILEVEKKNSKLTQIVLCTTNFTRVAQRTTTNFKVCIVVLISNRMYEVVQVAKRMTAALEYSQ